jgi:hypothetical protein
MRLISSALLLTSALACSPVPGPTDAGIDAGPSDGGEMAVCALLATPDCNGPVPTYEQLKPLFNQACVVCHYGQVGGPWPLTSYQDLSDWQDAVRSEVLNCKMPPQDSGIPITFEERQKIFTWVRCGRPL